MLFRRILFPTDFSQASTAMVPSVREMARQFDATVTVLNVFDLTPGYIREPVLEDTFEVGITDIPYTHDFQHLRNERHSHLQEFSQTAFPDVTHSVRLEDGEPAAVIQEVAESENTDLIMMPTKGTGLFRRLLLGSITAKVLHDVSCPVFVSAHEPHPPTPAPCGYRSIVCAVELNSEADEVFLTAKALADAFGARLCLLHIGPSSDVDGESATVLKMRHAFDKERGAETGTDTTFRVLDAQIPDGIRSTAIEEKADLVVVGRGHQKGNLSRIWSHLFTIIRLSPCPVLSV